MNDKLKDKINDTRELLYKQLESDVVDYENLLETSQELDELIIEYCEKEYIDFQPQKVYNRYEGQRKSKS